MLKSWFQDLWKDKFGLPKPVFYLGILCLLTGSLLLGVRAIEQTKLRFFGNFRGPRHIWAYCPIDWLKMPLYEGYTPELSNEPKLNKIAVYSTAVHYLSQSPKTGMANS